MRFTITVFLLFISIIALVQTPSTIEQDTAQGHQLLKEAYQLSDEGKYDDAVKLLSKSIEILKKVNTPSQIDDAYHALYHAYGYSGNWENALKYAKITYQRGEKSASKTDDSKQLIDIIYDIGYIFDILGEKDSTHLYYLKSIQLYENMDTVPYADLGLAHHNLSFNYRGYEALEKALFHAQQSYNYWHKNETDAEYMVKCYSNISKIYGKLNAFDLAKEYGQKSINIRTELKKNTIVTLANTASVMSDMGDTESSIFYYKKAINQIETNASHKESKKTISSIYNNLGLELKEVEDYKTSETMLLKALEVNPENIGAHVNLFSLYIAAPFDKYDEVLEQITEIEQMAIEQNSPFLPVLYVVKATGLARQNNFDEAFKNFQYAFNKTQGLKLETPLDRTALIDLDTIANTELNRMVMRGRAFLFQTIYKETN